MLKNAPMNSMSFRLATACKAMKILVACRGEFVSASTDGRTGFLDQSVRVAYDHKYPLDSC